MSSGIVAGSRIRSPVNSSTHTAHGHDVRSSLNGMRATLAALHSTSRIFSSLRTRRWAGGGTDMDCLGTDGSGNWNQSRNCVTYRLFGAPSRRSVRKWVLDAALDRRLCRIRTGDLSITDGPDATPGSPIGTGRSTQRSQGAYRPHAFGGRARHCRWRVDPVGHVAIGGLGGSARHAAGKLDSGRAGAASLRRDVSLRATLDDRAGRSDHFVTGADRRSARAALAAQAVRAIRRGGHSNCRGCSCHDIRGRSVDRLDRHGSMDRRADECLQFS